MKLLACWHIGKAKNVPFKLLLTTASAWVAAELAPLCCGADFSRETFAGKWRVWKALLLGDTEEAILVVFQVPKRNFNSRPWDKNHRHKRERERLCISVQTSRRLLPQPPDHLGLNLWQWKRSDVLELLPQTSQPTPNYPHCVIWIVSTHLRTAIQRILWMKETLCGGGCKAGMWEGTASSGCPDGTSRRSLTGEWGEPL